MPKRKSDKNEQVSILNDGGKNTHATQFTAHSTMSLTITKYTNQFEISLFLLLPPYLWSLFFSKTLNNKTILAGFGQTNSYALFWCCCCVVFFFFRWIKKAFIVWHAFRINSGYFQFDAVGFFSFSFGFSHLLWFSNQIISFIWNCIQLELEFKKKRTVREKKNAHSRARWTKTKASRWIL